MSRTNMSLHHLRCLALVRSRTIDISVEFHALTIIGYGKHACPGRFLASNELKVTLAHMLMKYDLKLDDTDSQPKFLFQELASMTNPAMKIMIRRREAEIDLDIDADRELSGVEE